MRRALVIVGAVLLVAVIAALIVPMWLAAIGFGLPVAGWAPVALTVILCFVLGGGLMGLIFWSSRRGYDEEAYNAGMDAAADADAAAAARSPAPPPAASGEPVRPDRHL